MSTWKLTVYLRANIYIDAESRENAIELTKEPSSCSDIEDQFVLDIIDTYILCQGCEKPLPVEQDELPSGVCDNCTSKAFSEAG